MILVTILVKFPHGGLQPVVVEARDEASFMQRMLTNPFPWDWRRATSISYPRQVRREEESGAIDSGDFLQEPVNAA